MKAWIEAMRLRTLPLALASVGMGCVLAAYHDQFRLLPAILVSLTAICLQILSNLANDYGDGIKGTDNADRIGPQRAIQSGAIDIASMKKAIIGLSVFTLAIGIATVIICLDNWIAIASFIGLGLGAVAAALLYTMGKRPYGYMGLGDFFVFVFFGLISVCGSYYMNTQTFQWNILLPAASIGCFSVGVLNLNNMRDRLTDATSGKRTMAVILGDVPSRYYHVFLITLGFVTSTIFAIQEHTTPSQFMFMLSAPLFATNMRFALQYTDPATLDPMLKQLAIATVLFVALFAFGFLFYYTGS